MVGVDSILPRELLSSNASSGELLLFSETLQIAQQATAGMQRRALIPPAPFWLLMRFDPQVEELMACCGGHIPLGWPLWFKQNREILLSHPFRKSIVYCIQTGPERGIASGRELSRLIGAVAQTIYSTNAELVRRNKDLALTKVSVFRQSIDWTDASLFIRERPDELGGHLINGRITLWMASHIGPIYADKMENQDAVYALPCGNGVVFALADGVSTSLGSRYGAAIAASTFCRYMQELGGVGGAEASMLLDAAKRTQRDMGALLDHVISEPGGTEAAEVMKGSSMRDHAAEAVLQNTRTAEKSFLQPALATTLIGGYLGPGGHEGRILGTLICIGDGAVERVGRDEVIHRIIATDPDVMEIAATMGPGKLAEEALTGTNIAVYPLELSAGEYIVVSSDGLTRGHAEPVWSKISHLAGDVAARMEAGGPTAAIDLLRDLAIAAERSDGEELFDDNISIIMVTAG